MIIVKKVPITVMQCTRLGMRLQLRYGFFDVGAKRMWKILKFNLFRIIVF